ncbi:MAG: hypothetical protein Q9160_006877 [Pyrenula sp. 1 TL-2023]
MSHFKTHANLPGDLGNISHETLGRIGQGFCGSVWATPTDSKTACAIKREDGGPGRSLYKDFIMHQRVFSSIRASQSRVRVPRCHSFLPADDSTRWDNLVKRFPEQFRVRCNALVSDRIPAIPRPIRERIIDSYCPASLRASAKQDEANQDCLIRPYLGRRRLHVRESRFKCFSLRNYPLHVDQMEDLELDTSLYARVMAETLAELYWRAHVDANDIEFVLAPPREDDHTIRSDRILAAATPIESQVLGDHVVWILDFDCCKEMPFDETGVEQAAKAFRRNDPFYPRPGRRNINDQRLWSEFKDHFLKASNAIVDVGGVGGHLPALWITLVEQGS